MPARLSVQRIQRADRAIDGVDVEPGGATESGFGRSRQGHPAHAVAPIADADPLTLPVEQPAQAALTDAVVAHRFHLKPGHDRLECDDLPTRRREVDRQHIQASVGKPARNERQAFMWAVDNSRRDGGQRLQTDTAANGKHGRKPLADDGIAGAQPFHHRLQRPWLLSRQINVANDASQIVVRDEPGKPRQRAVAKRLAATRASELEQGFAQSTLAVGVHSLTACSKPERQLHLGQRLGADNNDIQHAEVGGRDLCLDVDPGVAIAGNKRCECGVLQSRLVDVDHDAAVQCPV